MVILLLALGAVLITPHAAESAGGKAPSDGKQLTPKQIEAIVRANEDDYVYRNTVLQKLGIESEVFRGGGPSKVERTRVPSHGGGHFLILHVTNGLSWQYLVFHEPRNSSQQFWNNIGIAGQGFERPKFRVIKAGPDAIWIAIGSLASSGTGLVLYEEAWFEVGTGRTSELVRFPIKGYMVGWSDLLFDREYSSRIVEERSTKGSYEITVEFDASFSFYTRNPEREGDLFSWRKPATYILDPGTSKFRLDQTRSRITEEEIDGLYADGRNQFLQRNFEYLDKLANQPTPEQTEWFRQFLARCNDIPERARLARRLGMR